MENKYHLGIKINAGIVIVYALDALGNLTNVGSFSDLRQNPIAATQAIEHLILSNFKGNISGVAISHSAASGDVFIAGQIYYMLLNEHTSRVIIEGDWIRGINRVVVESGGQSIFHKEDVQMSSIRTLCNSLFPGVEIPQGQLSAACLTVISAGYNK